MRNSMRYAFYVTTIAVTTCARCFFLMFLWNLKAHALVFYYVFISLYPKFKVWSFVYIYMVWHGVHPLPPFNQFFKKRWLDRISIFRGGCSFYIKNQLKSEIFKVDFHLPKRTALLAPMKALFVLKIFKFLSWLFGHVGKTAWLERQS